MKTGAETRRDFAAQYRDGAPKGNRLVEPTLTVAERVSDQPNPAGQECERRHQEPDDAADRRPVGQERGRQQNEIDAGKQKRDPTSTSSAFTKASTRTCILSGTLGVGSVMMANPAPVDGSVECHSPRNCPGKHATLVCNRVGNPCERPPQWQ